MHLPNRASILVLHVAAIAGLSPAQEWTESHVVQQFLDQSPLAREVRARAVIAGAEARARTLPNNPRVSFSRESAGLTEFFQAEQTLPTSGRPKLLRQAGTYSIRAAESGGAFDLWQARSSLRLAFYQALATQEQEAAQSIALIEIDNVIRILKDREREGEGSRFDRLRAERERAELAAELSLVRAEGEIHRSHVQAFLPPGTRLGRITGQLESVPTLPDLAELSRRALAARGDYQAEQNRLQQFRLEQRAAERLRIPEPTLSAGLKRADIGANRVVNGPVVGVSIALPLFNKGQAEVARFAAEQERITARLQTIERQVRGAIEGTARAFQIQTQARDTYRRELAETGTELVTIAKVAYQEGEIGILQLLDAFRTQRQSQLRLLDIQLAVKHAQIELEQAVGEELPK